MNRPAVLHTNKDRDPHEQTYRQHTIQCN